MIKILIALAAGLLATVASAASTGLSSSTYNGMTAVLALDNNISSCALTGFETYPWFMLDMGQVNAVTAVLLTGYATNTLQILVGNAGNAIGPPGGFASNLLCGTVTGPFQSLNAPFVTGCVRVRSGRFISVQSVAQGVGYSQLQLCEIAFQ